MKEFDLDKANKGYPVCTRDGRDALILTTNRMHPTHHIVALIYDPTINQDMIKTFDDEGFYFEKNATTKLDLFLKD